MKCLRCNTELTRKRLHQLVGYTERPTSNKRLRYQAPINVESVYVCDNCGYIEFNQYEQRYKERKIEE